MQTTRNIGGLEIPKQYRRRGGLTREIKIIGWDVETIDGKVVLICDSEGHSKEIRSFDDCISMMTQKKYRGKIGLFYNLAYDVAAIAKWAPIECQKLLLREWSLNWRQKYLIKYIPKKQFTITVGHHTYRYQDLYQFYERSLEEAARGFL